MIKYSILIINIILLLASCSQIHEEIERVSSNNGKVDAVVIRSSGGGAAGSVSYKVYLVPHGQEIKNKKKGGNFVAVRAYDMSVYWENDQKLVISYPENSSIFDFSNFWFLRDDEGSIKYEIKLSLKALHRQKP